MGSCVPPPRGKSICINWDSSALEISLFSPVYLLIQSFLNLYNIFLLQAINLVLHVCMCAQLCPTLCKSRNCSPSGSAVHGISQARILERVVIAFSRGSSLPRDWACISCIGRWILYHWATQSRLPGEISITSDMQMTPPLWQKMKRN